MLRANMLIHHAAGHYDFLKGIDPYSCGVVAKPGWEIAHVTMPSLVPWQQGFDFVDEFLRGAGQGRLALCAMELRSPEPFSMAGFIEFNRSYRAVLEQWGVLVQGVNPVARTNVAPMTQAPASVCLHAFSHVRPNPKIRRPTFVVAGAGELREGTLESNRIIRRGETSAAAMLEKAAYVLDVMEERLTGLGVHWSQVTCVNVYTIHPMDAPLRDLVLRRLGPAARCGLCWHVTRPPVLEIEFEMDLRGVLSETWL